MLLIPLTLHIIKVWMHSSLLLRSGRSIKIKSMIQSKIMYILRLIKNPVNGSSLWGKNIFTVSSDINYKCIFLPKSMGKSTIQQRFFIYHKSPLHKSLSTPTKYTIRLKTNSTVYTLNREKCLLKPYIFWFILFLQMYLHLETFHELDFNPNHII